MTVYLKCSEGHGLGEVLTLDMLLYVILFSLPLESWAVQRDIYEQEKWSCTANVFPQCLA